MTDRANRGLNQSDAYTKRGITGRLRPVRPYKIIQKRTNQTDASEPIKIRRSGQTTHTQTHQKKKNQEQNHTHMQTAYHTNNQNNSVHTYKNLSHINGPKQFFMYK